MPTKVKARTPFKWSARAKRLAAEARQIPGQDGVWRQDKLDKARKRIKYGGPRMDSFVGLRPHTSNNKLTRLIAKWRSEADECRRILGGNIDSQDLRITLAVRVRYLVRCADELERLLKM